MRKTIRHSSHWGAFDLDVEDNRISAVRPFQKDPNPSEIIGSVADWATSPRRLTFPVVRRGWLERRDRRGRAEDSYVRVTWDEAEELVAGEIRRVADTYGNEAIFAGSYGWTSAGRFHHAATLLKRMLGLAGGYVGHMDTYSIAAGPVILRHILGEAHACQGRGTTLDTVVENSEIVVIFGALSPRTAQNEAGGVARHRLEGYLQDLVDRGTRIVLVSPSRDDLPDWVPADWWPIRPGTDTALMLALSQEIVAAGLHDRALIDRLASGVEEFLAHLSGQGDSVTKSADWAEGITGIEADRIRSLARDIARKRTMLLASWSLQRAQYGEQPYWAAVALSCVAGQIGLPGGGVGFGFGSLACVGAPFGTGKSPAMSAGVNPTGEFIPVARVSDMLLNPGAPFDYEGQTRHYPDIRLVYWAGGNPFHHHQDLTRLMEGWQRPETIIVQDPMWTATAQRGDIVLPASTSLERNDIAGSRRSDHMIAMQQAIAPLGEARSDYEIFSALATRLGVGEAFTEGRDEMSWLRHIYDLTRADAQDRLRFEMPDFDSFWAEGDAPMPVQSGATYLSDFRADPEAAPLATPTGRILLHSDLLAEREYEDCPPVPSWLPPTEWLDGADRTAPDVFHMLTPQPVGRLHSQLEAAPASLKMKRDGLEQLQMAPADAGRLGLTDGACLLVSNTRGRCLASLTVDGNLAPGVVRLPTGAWLALEDGLEMSGNPNILTRDIPASQFSQGCAAQTCLVRVEPYRGNLPRQEDRHHPERWIVPAAE
ncbi:Dimethyl sulfoxide/trimethylamine N-oxide reductase precursor (plasmid) [Sulfitobacter sp. THAF37]|uniref:molybdopterin-dependent oxidoreductase n=1 Tax=Sulfitobacter sp. THAF37 TaxID=2587855 RepID=UPI0012697744|nr:molybdopterin-dependent oxidoreductase [Sulfitobacter sp. THAF37]QFT60867.1 Dimethyl sulfoxide/trimethylamine N-oxide reductase precursor [Sulfitobacter sp. THAF37]